jgi:hypothetical protein
MAGVLEQLIRPQKRAVVYCNPKGYHPGPSTFPGARVSGGGWIPILARENDLDQQLTGQLPNLPALQSSCLGASEDEESSAKRQEALHLSSMVLGDI